MSCLKNKTLELDYLQVTASPLDNTTVLLHVKIHNFLIIRDKTSNANKKASFLQFRLQLFNA